MENTDEKSPPPIDVPEKPTPGSPSRGAVGPLFSGAAAERSNTAPSLRQDIRVWTRDLLIALGLALVLLAFLYQPVKDEGTSMPPFLPDQERTFINKFAYRVEPI